MSCLTDVPGFLVGSVHDLEACTGVTVILCPQEGAQAAAVIRGMASSTRQFGIGDPSHLVNKANAVVLSGGSAFGLDCASGVMTYLREQNIGFQTAYARVPVVPTAILYDLALGDPTAFPSPEMAYQAAQKASSGPVEQGCVGAGAGATVGKLFSVPCATKGGLGSASLTAEDGLCVGALVAVNSFGDVYDPNKRAIIAGARRAPERFDLVDMNARITEGMMPTSFGGSTNTTLAVIATNAKLGDLWLRRVASWASDAFTHHLRPCFSAVDGDVVVALSSEEKKAEPHRVGILAQKAISSALIGALEKATPLKGIPASSQIEPLVVDSY